MELAIQRIAWAGYDDGIVVALRNGSPGQMHIPAEPIQGDYPDDLTLGTMGLVRSSEWSQLGRFWRCVVS